MLTNNVVLKEKGLYRSWLTTAQPNYWPITWTSYWLEHKLWGLNPTGYHITNILIHTACVLLIWRILILLKIPAAWPAALVFAVHPVNVESVAWVAQRKTLLAMLFFLMAVLLYLKFENGNNLLLYRLSAGTFVLAMLSKGSVVGLPIVLLLIAWWRRGTITRRDVLRSVPFFGISAVMSCVEIWFQYNRAIGGDVIRSDDFFARSAGAGMAVWFYIYKAILPINLSFIYPRWQIDPKNWFVYIPLALLAALFLLLLRYRRSWGKSLLFALGYYVAMLLPILGFFNIYFMRYSLVADHYQYVSIIGLISFAAAVSYGVLDRLGSPGANTAKALGVLVVAIFAIFTWRQCHIYKDIETLWSDTLQKNPNSSIAHSGLGFALQSQGRFDEAISYYYQVIQIEPKNESAYNNLGNTLASMGRFDEAVSHYNNALRIKPNYATAHYNLAQALKSQGRIDEAISHYNKALSIKPDYAGAHINLGIVLKSQGKIDEAMSHYREALQIKPDSAEAYYNLGNALKSQGKLEEAISSYEKSLHLNPKDAEICNNMGSVLQIQGKLDEAISYYRRSVTIDPNYAAGHNNLGNALASAGRLDEAIAHIERAVALTKRQNAAILSTLTAVYAARGRFDDAAATAQEALEIASADKNNDLADQIRKKLELYRQKKY
jgi:tetratricopeptide (TPR) repeat protein